MSSISIVHAYSTPLRSFLLKLFVLILTYNADTFFFLGGGMQHPSSRHDYLTEVSKMVIYFKFSFRRTGSSKDRKAGAADEAEMQNGNGS